MADPARITASVLTICFLTLSAQCAFGESPSDARLIERGRYLVRIAGCNNCHTPGYAETGGNVAENKWLTGSPLGWNGPWGTTYAANLRLVMQTLSEEEWLALARTRQLRPPMPWFALRDMSKQDLQAIYRFIRYLGPAGEAAPAYISPGEEASGPVVRFPSPPK